MALCKIMGITVDFIFQNTVHGSSQLLEKCNEREQ